MATTTRCGEIMESHVAIPLAIFCTCGQVKGLCVLPLLFVQGGNRAMGVVPGAIPARRSSIRTTTHSSKADSATGFCSVKILLPCVPPITLLLKSLSECR
jgi:hypothetical protein